MCAHICWGSACADPILFGQLKEDGSVQRVAGDVPCSWELERVVGFD